jgi:hypothetical protein
MRWSFPGQRLVEHAGIADCDLCALVLSELHVRRRVLAGGGRRLTTRWVGYSAVRPSRSFIFLVFSALIEAANGMMSVSVVEFS